MTYEQKAKEILLAETGNYEGGCPRIVWYSLHKRITTALREAGNAKLEEAARFIETFRLAAENAAGERISVPLPNRECAANALRSLKSR